MKEKSKIKKKNIAKDTKKNEEKSILKPKSNLNKNILIVFFIILFVLLFIFFSFKSTQLLKEEKVKNKIKVIMNNLNYSKVVFDDKKLFSGDIIDKIKVNTENNSFFVYIYNQDEVYNIVNAQNYKEVYSNKKKFLKNDNDNDVIILFKNLFGAYGKINITNGNPQLKYFLPAGKYKVRKINHDNINPKLYIQENVKDNNGDIVENTLREIEFNNDLFVEIELSKNNFLDISENAILEIQKN